MKDKMIEDNFRPKKENEPITNRIIRVIGNLK